MHSILQRQAKDGNKKGTGKNQRSWLSPLQIAVDRLADQQHGKGQDDGDEAERQCPAVAARRAGVLVDGERNSLGYAGDVAREDDRRAELPHAAGEHQGHAREHRPAAERDSDREERVPPARAERPRCLHELAVYVLHADADGADKQREADHRRGDDCPAQGEDDADVSKGQELPQPAVAAKEEQEQIAGHDWRQHQRQVDQPFQQGLAAHLGHGQHIGGGKTCWQRDQRGRSGHLQRELDSGEVVRGEGEHERVRFLIVDDRQQCYHQAMSKTVYIETSIINFLLTWNCKHIANAVQRPLIEHVCREFGFEPPILCTPEELTGGKPDVE